MKLLPMVNKFKRFIKKLFNMSMIIPMENLKWFCCCCCCFCLICNWNKYFEEIFLQALNFELYQILRKVKNPSYIHSLNCTWVTFLLNFPLKKNTHPFKSAFEELENELMIWNSVKSGNPPCKFTYQPRSEGLSERLNLHVLISQFIYIFGSSWSELIHCSRKSARKTRRLVNSNV